MSYRLFLDDCRNPIDCVTYMHQRIGPKNPIYLEEWVVVRNYHEFTLAIAQRGLPEVVSFDHDLEGEHYGFTHSQEDWEEYHRDENRAETGYDCAVFLWEYCMIRGLKLPECFIHFMNAVGVENIKRCLKTPMYGSNQK